MARLVTIGSMRLIHRENRTQPIFEQKVDPRGNFAQRFRFRFFFISQGAFCALLGGSRILAAFRHSVIANRLSKPIR